MKFQKKDKIKCIRDFYDMNGNLLAIKGEYYYIYIPDSYNTILNNKNIVWFKSEECTFRNTDSENFKKYFITLQEERKLKLEKLENENR